MFEYIETVMTSQHIGINDNLEDNKKAILEIYVYSYLAINMAQSIIRDRLLFFAVHFEGFTENYPFLFEGCKIF